MIPCQGQILLAIERNRRSSDLFPCFLRALARQHLFRPIYLLENAHGYVYMGRTSAEGKRGVSRPLAILGR